VLELGRDASRSYLERHRVETGLFVGRCDLLIVAEPTGVRCAARRG
jgi:hypothetical protein